MTGDELGRWVITPELIHSLLRAKERADAGITSTLEAAIEQLEAMLLVNPVPVLLPLVDALKAFVEGDEVPLQDVLDMPPSARRKLSAAMRRRRRAR